MLKGLTAAALFPVYARHNPEAMERLQGGSGVAPQATFLVSGPLVGAVTGLVLGLLCWGASRLIPPVHPIGPASAAAVVEDPATV